MLELLCIVGTERAAYQRIGAVKTILRPCEAQGAPGCQGSPNLHQSGGAAGRAPWSWYGERSPCSPVTGLFADVLVPEAWSE